MEGKHGMRVVRRREATSQESNKEVRKRVAWLLALFVLVAVGLTVRLAWLQLYQGDMYSRMAYVNQNRQQLIRPKRGSIYDRNGKGLAISAQVDTISVNPALLHKETEKQPERIAEMADVLAEILTMERNDIYAKLTSSDSFVTIARKISREEGTAVRTYLNSVRIGSVFVDEDSKRFYPKENLASHIIGFTGVDDQGLSGMELELDGILKGEAGRILSEVDARGNPVRYDETMRLDARDGFDVTLTIDEAIQGMTEEALAGVMREWDVKNGASAIVMNPYTGEVLSMASLPDFNPNQPDAAPSFWDMETAWEGFQSSEHTRILWETVFRNKAVMDTYEPGSTFKAITAAAALESGIVTPNTIVVDRPLEMGEWTINCWKPGGHGEETFAEAMHNSCNPVFSKLSLDLGLERFYRFVRMFGFMDRTGIEIAGEPSQDEYRNLWHLTPAEIDMAVASFGQRFQVSPIQLISAYSAIANGGSLMKPTVIREIRDGEGRLVMRNEPEVVRKVISPQTAMSVRDMLEGVVSEGTGRSAYVSGYRMAGKTGTSETLQTEQEGRYVVSFMSFAPADDPQICLLIEVDWPQAEIASEIGGGRIVAPVAGKLTEQILTYLKVERDYSDGDLMKMTMEAYLPDVMDMTVSAARSRLASSGFVAVDGMEEQLPDAIVTHVSPTIGSSVPQGAAVILYSGADPQPIMVAVPDLKHLRVNEVQTVLSKQGLNLRIEGDGVAESQRPAAGEMVEKGEVLTVQFR